MKRDLWIRLKHYHFDHLVPAHLTERVAAAFGGPDASTRAFASTLSRKLDWPAGFALQAIEEYKRFVFLGVVSRTPVTPPKIIDQVWHEHILFSAAYRDFCKEVVRQDFDHHPELVPTSEQTGVFQAQYAATLELYEKEFNYPPPVLIWGTPKFDPNAPVKAARPAVPPSARSGRDAGYEDVPLYALVSDSGPDSCGQHGHAGAHAGHHAGHADSAGHGGHDGGSAGGGHDGGGSSCGGGSGCSSGCGGGGCGGG